MAKDPRFNFYPDNWDGGTEDFTLEQEGAYLRVIIMHSRRGRFTQNQAIDCLMRKTRGDAAACTGLWKFLIPKFSTDGKVFWSERLEKEMDKSKKHSNKQKERADKRWGNATASATAMPVGTGTGIRIENTKGVEFENYEKWTDQILDANDQHFEAMFMNEGLPMSAETFTHLVRDHLDLLGRYPNMKPPDQQRFRGSCMKHIREHYKDKIRANGKSKFDPQATLDRLNSYGKRPRKGAGT